MPYARLVHALCARALEMGFEFMPCWLVLQSWKSEKSEWGRGWNSKGIVRVYVLIVFHREASHPNLLSNLNSSTHAHGSPFPPASERRTGTGLLEHGHDHSGSDPESDSTCSHEELFGSGGSSEAALTHDDDNEGYPGKFICRVRFP